MGLSTVARERPKVTIKHDPFTWAVVTGFLEEATAATLARDFPADGFRVAGSNAKQFHVRNLVVDGTVSSSTRDLPDSWRTAARFLASADYARLLGAIVDRDLAGLRIDATLCRYPPGCSLAPHTDREVRDTTHVIYLNRTWRPEWGGMLRILRSADVDDVIEEVLPELHTSSIMVRSDRSWHAVTAVAPGIVEERLSVLIHATHPELAAARP